jgi:hypothetical protein
MSPGWPVRKPLKELRQALKGPNLGDSALKGGSPRCACGFATAPSDLSGIYCKPLPGDSFMADAPRITVEELKRRMDAEKDFTILDSRNPQAWAESDGMVSGAIRVPVDKLEENLSRIPKNRPVVAYCT